jgi:hypothetical protein
MTGNAMGKNRIIMIWGVVLVAAFSVLVGCKKDPPQSEGRQAQEPVSKAESLDGTSTFAAGVKIAAGDEPIDVRVGHLVPCTVDWNNDGKKDLVIGQFSGGSIRLYLNAGTDTEPVFEDFVLLEAGGKPIKLDAG